MGIDNNLRNRVLVASLLCTAAPCCVQAQAAFLSRITSPDQISSRFPVLYEAAGGDLVIMEATIQLDPLPWHYRLARYRFTADGSLISVHESDAGTGGHLEPEHSLELPDGSTALCGQRNDLGFYLRMASDGTVMSARSYAHLNNTKLTYMDLLNDSTLLLVGEVDAFSDPGAIVLKTDLNGVLEESWTDSIHGEVEFHRLVRTAPDGSVWLAGDGSDGTLDRGMHVLRTDAAGTVLWSYAMQNYWIPVDLQVLPSGAALLLADHNPSGLLTETDLIKIAADGTVLGHTRVEVVDPGASQGYYALSLEVKGADVRVTAWNDGQNVVMRADTDAVIQPVANTSDQALMADVRLQWAANGDQLLLADHIPDEVQVVFGRMGADDDPLCGGIPDTLALSNGSIVLLPPGVRQPITLIEQDLTSLFAPVTNTWSIASVCPTLGLGEPMRTMEVHAAPDPTTGTVQLSGPLMHAVQVFDATGHVVVTGRFPPLERCSVELGALPPGLYTVRARTSEGWRSVRVVKE